MNNFHLYVVRLMALALLAIATVMGVSPNASAASSESIEISFDLDPAVPSSPAPAPSVSPPKPTSNAQAEAAPQAKPLQIPTRATHVPVGVADDSRAIAELPPPPPEAYVTERSPQPTQPEVQPEPVEPEVQAESVEPIQFEPEPIQFEPESIAPATTPAPKPDQASVAQAPVRQPKPSTQPAEPTAEPTALSFDLNSTASRSAPPSAQAQALPPRQGGQAAPLPTPPNSPASRSLEALFQNGSNSIVAKAVGSAEGTRTPDGGKTWAFQGHVDPGNGVWNLGTFSYQHGAISPDEADRKQLERLRSQAQTLRRTALERGITLTLEEELNGIDLANQSPRAALSRGGYMDRLKEAHDVGLRGSDAVLWARTRSFLDPDTNRWNAPGLGNTSQGVTSDQARRMQAIAQAIQAHQQVAATPSAPIEQVTQQPIATAPPDSRPEQVASHSPTADQNAARMEKVANDIISLDLAPM